MSVAADDERLARALLRAMAAALDLPTLEGFLRWLEFDALAPETRARVVAAARDFERDLRPAASIVSIPVLGTVR